MENSKATIYDVAARAGVSIATVSRAMSGGSISAKSRQKVQDAIDALHYQPSAAHVHPQEKHKGSLGLVIGDFENPYCAMLCRGAEAEASRNGYSLQVWCHEPGVVSNDEMIRRILEHHPDGIALTGGLVEDGPAETILENLRRLNREMPVVTIGPLIEGMPSINIASDSFECVRKSMAHLINLGHRHIAFIGGTQNVRFSDARILAYRRAMERIGIPEEQQLVFPTGFTPQSGEVGVARMLAALPHDALPTAIVAINDVCALGVLSQLQKEGINVPRDIALIGCDNLFFSQYLNPPLTTVDLRATERGSFAMAELLGALNGGSTAPISHKLECSLIVRESCGATLGASRFT